MDYNALSTEDFIKRVLNNSDMCPCLMIGKYVNDFKHIYKDVIERVYTLNGVKRIVEEYDGIEHVNSGVLVLEGIGNLSDVGQNSLLKFIEESKLPIIILSYNDRVSPIIMSRMKIVVKKWYDIKKFDFIKVKDAMRALNEKKKDSNFDEYQQVQFMADNCPALYSVMKQAGSPFDYSNPRMISIMCSVEEGKS